MLDCLASSGFLDDDDVMQFARGFYRERQEALSSALVRDFGWAALDAHRASVGMVALARAELEEEERESKEEEEGGGTGEANDVSNAPSSSSTRVDRKRAPVATRGSPDASTEKAKDATNATTTAQPPAPWKSSSTAR